jgi:hypothetical protein
LVSFQCTQTFLLPYLFSFIILTLGLVLYLVRCISLGGILEFFLMCFWIDCLIVGGEETYGSKFLIKKY